MTSNWTLQKRGSNNQNLHVDIRLCQNGGESYGLSDASSGTKEIVLVLTALHACDASTVLLDEPGAHLHPGVLQNLRNWIYYHCAGQSLMIITHSQEMIEGSFFENTYQCRLRNCYSHLTRLEMQREGKVAWFINEPTIRPILFSHRVLFVEGISDARFVQAVEFFLSKKLHAYTMLNCDIIRLESKNNLVFATEISTKLGIEYYTLIDGDAALSGAKQPITANTWVKSEIYKAHEQINKNLCNSTLDCFKSLVGKVPWPLDVTIRSNLMLHNIFAWKEELENVFLETISPTLQYFFNFKKAEGEEMVEQIANTNYKLLKNGWNHLPFAILVNAVGYLYLTQHEELHEFIKFLEERKLIQRISLPALQHFDQTDITFTRLDNIDLAKLSSISRVNILDPNAQKEWVYQYITRRMEFERILLHLELMEVPIIEDDSCIVQCFSMSSKKTKDEIEQMIKQVRLNI